jgi:putative ATP-dependent endonuclease of the OLD family
MRSLDIGAPEMRVYSITIENFRGIRSTTINLPTHSVLTGDNNTGKSSLLEAIDLVLGPDRLNRRPPIDEHDFYQGLYLGKHIAGAEQNDPLPNGPQIEVEVTITELSLEQQARFGGHIEWLDLKTGDFYTEAVPAGVDAEFVKAALRASFIGKYDPDEDDFTGNTYFSRSIIEESTPTPFTKKDKQHCGFLFLRSSRTGSRALSLEHGSLLDIILRLKEVRPQMWEGTIKALAALDVANDPELGISGILESISGLALIKWRAISGLCDGCERDVLERDWAFVA